ncbi:DUF2894 domain-containing protein [Stenotrophomonas sp. SY1]|uniref:DUF2894 domain-containing protein n=1 Tax=Stenotrophomonas sp. SY1 TaxID=477235 RepID=UPI001E337050|nr:DUF2894 domain-containing protein [Stenotrophomonas sp. SY1]MCD9088493.1 DUF2894 domain-containing protein [Stenotrophomonas sp. SY1]
MRSNSATAQSRLDAWRAQGADRIDPVRFSLISALARRAEQHDGLVRQQLDARLSQLVAAYAEAVDQPSSLSVPCEPTPSPLKLVLDKLNAVPLQYPLPLSASGSAAAESSEGDDVVDPAPMPVLDEFQQLWSRIRIESLLRQCLDSLPEDAGPLHSSVLTYRAMALMQDISPDYLQHFIAYVDVLTWMEQLGGGEGGNTATGRAPAKRKSAPRKKK